MANKENRINDANKNHQANHNNNVVLVHSKLKNKQADINFNNTSKVTLSSHMKSTNPIQLRKLSHHQFSVDQCDKSNKFQINNNSSHQESNTNLTNDELDSDLQSVDYQKQNNPHKRLSNCTAQSKLPPSNYKNMMIISEQKQKKRQSNSYCKPDIKKERNDSITYFNDSININTKGERQSERLRTLEDQSSMMDAFFEQKYKNAQQSLLQTKSKLYEKDCKLENAQSELRKYKRENKLQQEKLKHLEQELQQQTKKKLKYKQIAKQFKQNLDQIEQTLTDLKVLSQDEIKQLKSNIILLESQTAQQQAKYQNNMNAISTYLQRIQKMLSPQDQNYSFNIKVLSDLIELCSQMRKLSVDEDQRIKESQKSYKPQRVNSIDKSLIEMEFLISQSSAGNIQQDQQLLSNKTKRLLDDYEKLRYESETIKLENQKLKSKINQPNSLEKSNKHLHVLSTYNSKESIRNQQSLSVGDLMQYDSIQQINNKLEEQNTHLERQMDLMKQQMIQLTQQTKEMHEEREQFRQQIQNQNQYIQKLVNQSMHSNNSIDSKILNKQDQTVRQNNNNFNSQDVQSDTYSTNQSQDQNQQNNYQQEQIATQKRYYNNNYNNNQNSLQVGTTKLYNPYNMSPTSSDYNQSENLKSISKQNKQISFKKLQIEDMVSQSDSNIISSRTDQKNNNINTDRQSNNTIDSAQRGQFNIFKRTVDYCNQQQQQQQDQYHVNHQTEQNDSQEVSYRQQFQNTKVFNITNQKQGQQNHQVTMNKKSMPRPPSNINNALSSTSPNSVLNHNMLSGRDNNTSAQNIFKNNQRMHSMQTLKRPTSLGSTTTLVMNEKARALKDEISTLDDEIQQLQMNLKRAISKRETKTTI